MPWREGALCRLRWGSLTSDFGSISHACDALLCPGCPPISRASPGLPCPQAKPAQSLSLPRTGSRVGADQAPTAPFRSCPLPRHTSFQRQLISLHCINTCFTGGGWGCGLCPVRPRQSLHLISSPCERPCSFILGTRLEPSQSWWRRSGAKGVPLEASVCAEKPGLWEKTPLCLAYGTLLASMKDTLPTAGSLAPQPTLDRDDGAQGLRGSMASAGRWDNHLWGPCTEWG